MTETKRAMSLGELLQDQAPAGKAGGIVVEGLALDSRAVRAGDAFVALKGARQHGITFAPMALAHGAVVVLAEMPESTVPAPADHENTVERPANASSPVSPEKLLEAQARESGSPNPAAPTLWIRGLRERLGPIASRFYGDPSAVLTIVGVTGTNGKTSTVQLLAQALDHAGHRAATIGTLGAGLVGAINPGARTTPDAIEVQRLLANFRDAGASHVAMEVSSHALDQGRVNGVRFHLTVFTNLTRDHLDYHGTMQDYGAAKERLFSWPNLAGAIINVDDAFGRALASRVRGRTRVIGYGIGRDDADVVARSIETAARGLRFRLETPWGKGDVQTRLLGRFNVSNLLAVAACLGELGLSFAAIADALAALEPVSGRMNRLGGDDSLPLVVVDYAHTPDALEQALTSLRAHCAGRLFCVFGCGGERDAGKRPEMGAIAEALADVVIVTDDNPRGEDGDAIVAAIVAGLKKPDDAVIQRNRGAAIARAVRDAGRGDVVLIAGKGHEPYQEIGGVRHAFDDIEVARSALEARP